MREVGETNGAIKVKLGPPSVYIVAQWATKCLEELPTDTEEGKAEQARLTAVLAATKKDWQLIQKYYPLLKVNKMHRNGVKRIGPSCPHKDALDFSVEAQGKHRTGAEQLYAPIMAWVAKQKSFRAFLGTASPGEMERQVRMWLDGQRE